MELKVTQIKDRPFAGPYKVYFTFERDKLSYDITIEQYVDRNISVICPDIENCKFIYRALVELLMLFDGQFYDVSYAFENGADITKQWDELPCYSSDDFMRYRCNRLVKFNQVLNGKLFAKWLSIREELDIIHKMVLYCLSDIHMPLDMKCAFMTESFEGLSDLINKERPELKFTKKVKKESRSKSKLNKKLRTCINQFDLGIFDKEVKLNDEEFFNLLVWSRNRIAHINELNKRYLVGDECVIYTLKLSLLYRIILFDLMEIDQKLFEEPLRDWVSCINEHIVTVEFFNRLSDEKT